MYYIQGYIKFHILLRGGGGFIKSAGKEYPGVKGEGITMAVRKNITWKIGKGKQYHFLYNIEAVGKNIKWGRIKIFKNGGGEEYQDVGSFIHP